MKTWKMKAGDIHFDGNGRSRFIVDDEKAAQDVALFILSEQGLDTAFRAEEIRIGIARAIDKLKAQQSLNPNATIREKISGIKEFVVVPNPDNPKNEYYFFLTVSTEAGDEVQKLFDAENFTDLSHLLPNESS